MEHADRALKLKPGDPDALEIRGSLEYWRWMINLEPDQPEPPSSWPKRSRTSAAAVDRQSDRGLGVDRAELIW